MGEKVAVVVVAASVGGGERRGGGYEERGEGGGDGREDKHASGVTLWWQSTELVLQRFIEDNGSKLAVEETTRIQDKSKNAR